MSCNCHAKETNIGFIENIKIYLSEKIISFSEVHSDLSDKFNVLSCIPGDVIHVYERVWAYHVLTNGVLAYMGFSLHRTHPGKILG